MSLLHRWSAVNKREQDKLTREMTKKLATFTQLLGGTIQHWNDRVQVSGNGMEGDSAYVFTVKFEDATFNVEVFGDAS